MSQSQNVKLISGAQNYQGQEKAELLTVLEEKLERHDPRHAWHPGFLDVAHPGRGGEGQWKNLVRFFW